MHNKKHNNDDNDHIQHSLAGTRKLPHICLHGIIGATVSDLFIGLHSFVFKTMLEDYDNTFTYYPACAAGCALGQVINLFLMFISKPK